MSARMLEAVEDNGDGPVDDRTSHPVAEEESMQKRSTAEGRRCHALGAFLLGAAAGGLAGLLLTPMSGRELRGRISDETRKARDEAAGMARKTQERAAELADRAQGRARETYEETAGRAREVVDDTKAAAQAHKEALEEAWRAGKVAYERELAKDE